MCNLLVQLSLPVGHTEIQFYHFYAFTDLINLILLIISAVESDLDRCRRN